MSKPIIGIVAKHYRKDGIRLETFIRDEVEQAIFDNGGISIGILPPNEDKIKATDDWQENLTTIEKQNLYAQITLCDGIILQGGGFSDEYECFIAKYCHEYDIPLLGICAGKHNMVRALSGKLGKLDNNNHNSQENYVHSIHIESNSIASKIFKEKDIMVNSRHVRYSLNAGHLKITAFSPDGIDEIVEDEKKTFFVGVQFHPESLYKKDKNMKNLFLYFLDICANRDKSK